MLPSPKPTKERPRTFAGCWTSFDNACEVSHLEAGTPPHRGHPGVVEQEPPIVTWTVFGGAVRGRQRLRDSPSLGVVYVAHKSGVVRRVLLTRTKRHVYFRLRVGNP